jgi:hypothetical protein
MLYRLYILKRYGPGTERITEKLTHTASCDLEAIRTAKEHLHHCPPTASGFSLRSKDGREIYRWFKTDAEAPAGPKGGL